MNRSKKKNIKYLLNTGAPNGEHVAYINDDEASILRYMGGSGRTDNNPYGIPSYDDVDESGGDFGDYSGEGDSSYGGGDDEQTSPQSDYSGSAKYDTINSASDTYSQAIDDAIKRNIANNAIVEQNRQNASATNAFTAMPSLQYNDPNDIFDGNPYNPDLGMDFSLSDLLESNTRYQDPDPDGLFGYESKGNTLDMNKEQQNPNSFYNLNTLEEEQKKAEDVGSKFASLFGIGSDLEYDKNTGWKEGTQFSPTSFVNSPVGFAVTPGSALLAPALNMMGNKTITRNGLTSNLIDKTRDYDSFADKLFGPKATYPEYSPSSTEELNDPNVFGDDGGSDESMSMFGRRMPRRQPVRQAPVEDNLPPVAGPLDYYQQDYEKQYSYWDGNKFVLAPLVRKV